MRFRFKTNDNLVYNKKINVPVCVISISSVLQERNWYYPQIELQDIFFMKTVISLLKTDCFTLLKSFCKKIKNFVKILKSK